MIGPIPNLKYPPFFPISPKNFNLKLKKIRQKIAAELLSELRCNFDSVSAHSDDDAILKLKLLKLFQKLNLTTGHL